MAAAQRAAKMEEPPGPPNVESCKHEKNPDGRTPVTTGHGPAAEELLRPETPPGLKRWGKLALIAAIVIVALGIGLRMWRAHNTAAWTDDQAVMTVQVIKPGATKTGGVLNLPGDVQAFTSAPIYGQVSGYVKKWDFDIGARGKKGQLLAELDTPPPARPGAQA